MSLPPMSPFNNVRMRFTWEYVRALIWAYLKTWLRQRVWPAVRRPLAMTAALMLAATLYINAIPIQQFVTVNVARLAAARNAVSLPAVNLPSASAPALPAFGRIAHIDAKQGWQSTGLTVEKGTKVSFEVTNGQWTSQKGVVAPMGAEGSGIVCTRQTPASRCVEPLPSAPIGSLIARIGDQIFSVPSTASTIAPASGTLELRINDADAGLSDNDGELEVRIRVGP
jgi:hypothetical protein